MGIYPGIWRSSSVFHALGADSGATLVNLNGGGENMNLIDYEDIKKCPKCGNAFNNDAASSYGARYEYVKDAEGEKIIVVCMKCNYPQYGKAKDATD